MASVPREGARAVGSLLSGALSWLAVVTIGLAPTLVYWLLRVMGRALRRKAPGPLAGSPLVSRRRGSAGSSAMPLGRVHMRPPARITRKATQLRVDLQPAQFGA